MNTWKTLATKTKIEIKALIISGILIIVLIDILAMFIPVYAWDVLHPMQYTSASEASPCKQFAMNNLITLWYLLIIIVGIFFSTTAHTLTKKFQEHYFTKIKKS